MPRPSIDDIRSIGDVATLYRWNVDFVSFPTALAGPPTTESLNLRAETTEMPKRTGQSIETLIRGHKVKQPGIYDYGNVLTMTFVETVDSVIANFMRNWREICSETRTGIAQNKVDVEATILITRLNNLDESIWEYKLVGCFLEDMEAGGTLDGQSSDSIKPSLTFSYDYFEDRPL